MTFYHCCVKGVLITKWKMDEFGVSTHCKISTSISNGCQRNECICRRLMESINVSDIKHTCVPGNVNCRRKCPLLKQYLTKRNGDCHHNADWLTDGTLVSAYDKILDGKCSAMVPEKTSQKDVFRFPSVESLSGESTTPTDSDEGPSSSSLSSSSSFSSPSSNEDDLRLNGDVLSGTCSESGIHETVAKGFDSEDKFDLSSSNDSEDSAVFPLSTLQIQNHAHLREESAKSKEYEKLKETLNSSYFDEYKVGNGVHLLSKHASSCGYRQTSVKNIKENTDKNDRKISFYRSCESDSGNKTFRRMCKSLNTNTKRNKKCKYFNVTKEDSNSSSEDLQSNRGYSSSMLYYKGEISSTHGYSRLLVYNEESELSSSSMDEADLDLHSKKNIGVSNKYRALETRGEHENVGNIKFTKGERYDGCSKNHTRDEKVNRLNDNFNNNANQDDSHEKHPARGNGEKYHCSKFSGNLVEELQRKSQSELKHHLVQLIKEQDKVLRELDFVETMKGKAVRGRSCIVVDKTRWKLEMKAVENNYKMRVDGIVSHLKASLKSENVSSTASVKSNDAGKEPQSGVNNNADSRRTEHAEESSGFFRNLFKRGSRSTNREDTRNAHAPTGFSLRKLFRRTRKVKDNGSSKLARAEQDQEEVNKTKYETFNEKYMSTSLQKLKRILKNMLKDFSHVSDVDLLLEEAKLLAGVSDEMECICREEITKIETKFRKKIVKKICKGDENYQEEKIEENVVLDESEPGVSHPWRKL